MKISQPPRSLAPVFVIAKYHDLLRRLGLDTMPGVKRFEGALIKNHKGQRDIQRIHLADTSPPVTFFLKRNWKPYKKDGLCSLFTRGQAWSQSRVEWENSLALQRAGLLVAEPIAFGEECNLLWENFSFILTAAARGEITLEEFLRSSRDKEERARVLVAVARDIRRMHDAGLASPDLFTRHIFIERGPTPRMCLIDMARLDVQRRISEHTRARDLAALHVTAPLRFVTTRERLFFFRAYGGSKVLRSLVLARAAHLLTRKKFADFTTPR